VGFWDDDAKPVAQADAGFWNDDAAPVAQPEDTFWEDEAAPVALAPRAESSFWDEDAPPAQAAAGPRDYSVTRDVLVDAPKELLKGPARGVQRYLGAHGSAIEMVGDVVGSESMAGFGRGIAEWWNEQASIGIEARDPDIRLLSVAGVLGGAAESAPTMLGALAWSAAGHPHIGTAMLTASEALPEYSAARNKGVDTPDAVTYTLLSGLGTYFLEKVGLDAITGRNPALRRMVNKLGDSYVAGALVNFAVEGTQESVQEIYQNAVRMGWDEDQEIFENALVAGLSGGVLGGASHVGFRTLAKDAYGDYVQNLAEKTMGAPDVPSQAAPGDRAQGAQQRPQEQVIRGPEVKPGQVVYARRTDRDRKDHRGIVQQVLDEQTVRVKFGEKEIMDLPRERLKIPSAVATRQTQREELAQLDPERRGEVRTAAKALDALLKQSPWYDPQLAEGEVGNERQQNLNRHQAMVDARRRAAEAIGRESADISSLVTRAEMLPEIQSYLESDAGRQAAAADRFEQAKYEARRSPIEINEAEIEERSLVYKGGEWYRAASNPEGGTRLEDGTTIEVGDFEQVTDVGLVFRPGDEGYDLAEQEFDAQEQRSQMVQETGAQLDLLARSTEFAQETGVANPQEAADGISRTIQQSADPRMEVPYPGAAERLREPGGEGVARAASAARAIEQPDDPEAIREAFGESDRISSLIEGALDRDVRAFEVTGRTIESPRDLAMLAMPLRTPYFESLKVAVLNDRNEVVHSTILTVGTLDGSLIDAQMVVSAVEQAARGKGKGARRVMLSHNHPSGDPRPSQMDLQQTDKLRSALADLDIDLVDHVITDGESYYSLQENRLGTVYTDLAPWEAMPRSRRRRIDKNTDMSRVAGALRSGDPDYGHVIYLDTRMRIQEIERIPLDMPEVEVRRLVARGVSRSGSSIMLLQFPTESGKVEVLARKLSEMAGRHSAMVMDVNTADMASWREQRKMMFAEKRGAHSSELREGMSEAEQNQVIKEAARWIRAQLPDQEITRAAAKPLITRRYLGRSDIYPLVDRIVEQANKMKMRGFAGRVRTMPGFEREAPGIPKQEKNYYNPQVYSSIQAQLEDMTEDELRQAMKAKQSLPMDSEHNFAVLAGLEIINRKHQQGRDATNEVETLANLGTSVGQLLRQYGQLRKKQPVVLLKAFEQELAQQNRFLTDRQRARLTELMKADFVASDANLAAEKVFRADPTREHAELLDETRAIALKAKNDMMRYAGQLTPKKWTDIIRQLMQGNLLVVTSHAINTQSNVIKGLLDVSGQSIAATADLVRASVTQHPRTVGFPSLLGRIAGAKQGLKSSVKGLWTGTSEDKAIHGEMHRGFHPLRAWVQALASSKHELLPVTGEGKVSFNDRAKKIIEGTLGIPAEVNFRLLALGDEPFKLSTYHAVLREQARLRGLKGKERTAFLKTPPANVQVDATAEALQSVYQEKNALLNHVTQGISKLRQSGPLGDWFDALVLTPTMPFKTTPANVFHWAVKFAMPEYSVGLAIFHAAKARGASTQAAKAKRTRQAMLHMGTAAVSYMMMTAAKILVDAGLIAGSPDEEQKERALQYATQRPLTVNVSGVRAMYEHWKRTGNWDYRHQYQPDDELHNLLWYGFFGIDALLVADSERRAQREGIPSGSRKYIDNLLLTVPEVFSAGLEMTVMQGVLKLLDAVERKDYTRWLHGVFRVITSVPVPNAVAAFNRSQQEYLPDMRPENAEEALRMAVEEKNPFLRLDDIYPWRFDPLGQPIRRTPEGRQAWAYHLLDPRRAAGIPDDPNWRIVRQVYQATGDSAAIPPIPRRTLNVNREKVELDREQYARYAELVGTARRALVAQYAAGQTSFERYTPEQQLRALTRLYDQGGRVGRSLFLREMRGEDATRRAPSWMREALRENRRGT